MNGTQTVRRRTARKAVIVAVALLILVVGYVSSWLAVSKAAGAGLISGQLADRLRPVFNPIFVYTQSELIGAEQLRALWWKINPMRVSQNEYATVYSSTDAMVLAPPDLHGIIAPPGIQTGRAIGPMPAPQAAAAIVPPR